MKGDDIFERLIQLAVKIVQLVEALPSTATTKHIGQQLVRSATSGGANYQEARGAESRNDFVHKLGVALKEVCETHYGLRLVEALRLTTREVLQPLMQETTQLSRILASSVRTARASSPVLELQKTKDNRQPVADNR